MPAVHALIHPLAYSLAGPGNGEVAGSWDAAALPGHPLNLVPPQPSSTFQGGQRGEHIGIVPSGQVGEQLGGGIARQGPHNTGPLGPSHRPLRENTARSNFLPPPHHPLFMHQGSQVGIETVHEPMHLGSQGQQSGGGVQGGGVCGEGPQAHDRGGYSFSMGQLQQLGAGVGGGEQQGGGAQPPGAWDPGTHAQPPPQLQVLAEDRSMHFASQCKGPPSFGPAMDSSLGEWQELPVSSSPTIQPLRVPPVTALPPTHPLHPSHQARPSHLTQSRQHFCVPTGCEPNSPFTNVASQPAMAVSNVQQLCMGRGSCISAPSAGPQIMPSPQQGSIVDLVTLLGGHGGFPHSPLLAAHHKQEGHLPPGTILEGRASAGEGRIFP